MTEEHKASRTIVKSPPELWAECSVAQSLARHLGEFGEIRITRLEPETTVAWEGELASGTVRLEPSGWGTQVTLTAMPIVRAVPEPGASSEAEADAELVPGAADPEPLVPEPEPVVAEPESVVTGPESVVPEPESVVPGPESVVAEPESVVPEHVQEPDAVVEPEVVARAQPIEKPDYVARPHVEGADRRHTEPLPRWSVFARIRARLGRRSHGHQHERASRESERNAKVATVQALEEAQRAAALPPEPAEPLTYEPEPIEQVPESVEQVPGMSEEAPESVEQVPGTAEAPEPIPQLDPQAMLVGALDSLGQAHHRPFSRA